MTAAEKRDFKKASGFWGEKGETFKYLLVFDLLNEALRKGTAPATGLREFMAQKKIAAAFGNGAGHDQLGEAVAALYANLLKSLRGSSYVGRSRREVQNCLSNIHYLYHKRLFDAAHDWVGRGKNLAGRNGLHYYKLELLFWERKLLFARKLGNFVEQSNAIALSEAAILAEAGLVSRLQAMFCVLHGKGNLAASPAEVASAIAELEANFDGWEGGLSGHPFGRRILHQCAGIAIELLLQKRPAPVAFLGKPLDPQLRLFHFEKVILSMHETNLLEEDPHVFHKTVSDYIATCIQIGELARAAAMEPHLPADPRSPEFLEFTIYARLLLFFKKGDYAGGKKFVDGDGIAAILDGSEGKIAISRYLFICFYAGLLQYRCGDLRRAGQFFQRMYDAEPKGQVIALTIVARMVDVFIEVKRETHFKGPSFYEKMLRELRELLEAAGQFDGFNKELWAALKAVERPPKGFSKKEAVQKLADAAATSAHPEMNGLLAGWFGELDIAQRGDSI